MFISLVTILLLIAALISLSLQQSNDNKVSESKFNTFIKAVSSGIKTLFSAVWTQKGGDIDGEAAIDYSGFVGSVSVSSDGNTVAIGAIGNDDNGSNSGHVRVYQYIGGVWTQKGGDIDGEAAGDFSGISSSLSSDGNTVAIGAYGNDDNGSNSGHVRVFEYIGTDWTQKGGDIDGEAVDDYSGYSVSLSSDGNTVAIGAIYNDGNVAYSGHVRVFEYIGTDWTQKGGDIDGEAAGDNFGYSVSLSSDGNTVAIGAPYNDGNGSDSGHVRVFEYIGTDWTQKGGDIDGEAAGDLSGYFGSVSLSSNGNTVAIGAPLNNDNASESGHVRVFEYIGTDWTQKGGDIDGETAGDYSGLSVSLSSDGNTVAIGGYGNDGNGYYSGHVRVFEYISTDWTQKGGDIDGEAELDQSGTSVSLSSDGNTVAIGAYGNDGNGYYSGHVRVYTLESPSTSVPTVTPTEASIIEIIESPHNYENNMNEKWAIDIPGASCYTVTMDPQSWTPNRNDFVRIFAITNGVRRPFRKLQKRLYKKRLSEFPETDIVADSLEIEFRSDAYGTNYGFKAYITECD